MPKRKKPFVPKTKPTAEELRGRLNLSIEEARILTGYSRPRVEKLCDDGEWQSFPEGKRTRIITDSIVAYQLRKAGAQ